MEMLSRVFIHRKSLKYKDILQQIVANYNNKIHSSHGFSPIMASDCANHEAVWQRLYGGTDKKETPVFTINQKVRLSLTKHRLEKGIC